MRSLRVAGPLAVVVAGLALAGCSASSGGSGATSAPPSTASTTVTQTQTASSSAPPSTPPASTTSSSQAGDAADDGCTNGQLAISAGRHDGAAGNDGFPLLFRNTSSRTCTLHGYPGLDALRTGKPALHAARDSNGYLGGSKHGLPTVRLRPGQTASALVEYSNIQQGNSDACSTAPKVAVTAANTTRTIVLNETVTICRLTVHPTVAGTTGSD